MVSLLTIHHLTLPSMSVMPTPPPTYSLLTYPATQSYTLDYLLLFLLITLIFLVIKAMHAHIENVENSPSWFIQWLEHLPED